MIWLQRPRRRRHSHGLRGAQRSLRSRLMSWSSAVMHAGKYVGSGLNTPRSTLLTLWESGSVKRADITGFSSVLRYQMPLQWNGTECFESSKMTQIIRKYHSFVSVSAARTVGLSCRWGFLLFCFRPNKSAAGDCTYHPGISWAVNSITTA